MKALPAVAAALMGACLAGCTTPEAAAPAAATPAINAPLPAQIQIGRDAEVHDIAKLDEPPTPVFQARPQYPFDLRSKNVTGGAVVDFIVGPDGKVYNAYAFANRTPHLARRRWRRLPRGAFGPGAKAAARCTPTCRCRSTLR